MFTKRRRKESEWEGVWEENWTRSTTPPFSNRENISSFSTRGREEEKEDKQSGGSSWLQDLFKGEEGGGGDSSWADWMGPESGGGEGGAEAAGGAGGESGSFNWGPLGYFAAAVLVQHVLSGDTNREYEGQETSDLFSGSVGTEPWWAWAKQQAGWDDPTSGEKFDAALKNEDWSLAIERLPSTLHYWFNPAQTSGYEVIKEQWGGDWAKAIFPLEGFFGDSEWVEEMFGEEGILDFLHM